MASMNRVDAQTGYFEYLIVNTSASLPAGYVTNAMITGSAGINAEKLESYQKAPYAQAGNAATETVMLAIIRGSTGEAQGFECTNVTDCAGSSTVTVDLQKNGVTMLSSVVTLDAATGNLGVETGTLSVTSLADGDVITAVITANQSGTDALATGVGVQFDYNEDHPGA